VATPGAGRGQRLKRRAPEVDGPGSTSGPGGPQAGDGRQGVAAAQAGPLAAQAGPPAGYYAPARGGLPPGTPASPWGALGGKPYPSGVSSGPRPGEPTVVRGAPLPKPPSVAPEALVPTGAPPGSARRRAMPGPYVPGPRPTGPYSGGASVRATPARTPGAPGRQAEREGARPKLILGTRNRRVVRRLDIWSVAKVSFVFYLCVLIVLLVAGTVLWNVAAAFGVITTFEKLVRSLFALTTFKVRPMAALAWGAAIGGALCFIGILLNVLAAILYNLISDIVGGLQVVVLSEEDT
jgi:hypothetical protein